jgi:Leucine-rich repeat (LRR) protein
MINTLISAFLISVSLCLASEDVTELDFSIYNNISSKKLIHISFLEYFPNLTSLDLSGQQHIEEELTTLKSLKKIERLNLNRCLIQSVKPIRHLKNIRILNLNNNYISSIKPIIKLPHLEELLIAYGSCIQDIELIGKCTTLITLDLSFVFTHDDDEIEISYVSLEFLRPLIHLKNISLVCGNRINSIQPLTTLISLNELNLTACQSIDDIQLVGHMTSLRILKLGNTYLNLKIPPNENYFDFLTDLTNLKKLEIDHCANIQFLKLVNPNLIIDLVN